MDQVTDTPALQGKSVRARMAPTSLFMRDCTDHVAMKKRLWAHPWMEPRRLAASTSSSSSSSSSSANPVRRDELREMSNQCRCLSVARCVHTRVYGNAWGRMMARTCVLVRTQTWACAYACVVCTADLPHPTGLMGIMHPCMHVYACMLVYTSEDLLIIVLSCGPELRVLVRAVVVPTAPARSAHPLKKMHIQA